MNTSFQGAYIWRDRNTGDEFVGLVDETGPCPQGTVFFRGCVLTAKGTVRQVARSVSPKQLVPTSGAGQEVPEEEFLGKVLCAKKQERERFLGDVAFTRAQLFAPAF